MKKIQFLSIITLLLFFNCSTGFTQEKDDESPKITYSVTMKDGIKYYGSLISSSKAELVFLTESGETLT